MGAYAAVIPRWVGNLLEGRECVIHGDGETSRDFCYIDNVVQANLRHSQADISKISDRLGYVPTHSVRQGLEEALQWYAEAGVTSG